MGGLGSKTVPRFEASASGVGPGSLDVDGELLSAELLADVYDLARASLAEEALRHFFDAEVLVVSIDVAFFILFDA